MSETQERAIHNHIQGCREKIEGYRREVRQWEDRGFRDPACAERALLEIAEIERLIAGEERAIYRHQAAALELEAA